MIESCVSGKNELHDFIWSLRIAIDDSIHENKNGFLVNAIININSQGPIGVMEL